MTRGKLIPPNLDDRTWQDIVDEVKALIPKYAPEWTDHNPSDLGITLVELFAWIVESMIYRLNKVPDKNFIEFLNLIGITRDPATPASAFLTYHLTSGTPPTMVTEGSQAATQQTEGEEAIVFETDQDLRVLPINITTALYLRKVISTKYKNATSNLVGSPLSGITINIPSSQSIMITLGFDAASTETISLLFRLSKPAKKNDIDIVWLYSRGNTLPTAWPNITTVNDGTNVFQKNGTVSLTIPADWSSQNPQSWSSIPADSITDRVDQSLFWIGIRISNLLPQAVQLGLEHILFNSVSATNALTITQMELLGVSSGKPFEFFELKYTPLFKRPRAEDPYDHLIIQVREPLVGGGFGSWTNWTHLDDFPEGPSNYFRLNPVTSTINFGNYDSITSPDGHGSIPPAGSEIRAQKYRYVIGGVGGNVPSDTIKVIRTPITGVITSVINLGAATGGSNEEKIEDAKRRGPEVLRNRYRTVTLEDYEYLATEAKTDVKKVRCLPPRLFTSYDTLPAGVSVGDPWTYGGLNRDTGNVNVIIIPEAPLSNPTPMPSEELLQEVSDYLEERRTVTSMLHVTFPRYLPIRVHLDVKVWQKAVDTGLTPDPATSNQLRDEIEAKVREFLHPIMGGPEKKGWEVGHDITLSSLFEFIKPDSEIAFISDLKIEAMTPLYEPIDRPFVVGVPSVPSVWIQLADYEIVCGTAKHIINVSKAWEL